MEIGKKIKEARVKSGLTQEQVAEQIFVSRQTLSNWENGKTLPDIVSVINLSDLYDLTLDELLKGDIKMKNKLERDRNLFYKNKRLLILTLGLLLILAVVRISAVYIGQDFKDFIDAALPWVLLGIGVIFGASFVGNNM